MKRIFALLLCLMMAFSTLAGCSGGNNNPTEPPAPPATEPETNSPDVAPEPPAAPSAPELGGKMKVVATSESYVDLFDKFTDGP